MKSIRIGAFFATCGVGASCLGQVFVTQDSGNLVRQFSQDSSLGFVLDRNLGSLNGGSPSYAVAVGPSNSSTGASPLILAPLLAGSSPSQILGLNSRNGGFLWIYTPLAGYMGGLNVAGGDVNGDGVGDIISGTASGAAMVHVADGVTLQTISQFLPYGAGFIGGVSVAAGDFTGDGRADIVTAPMSLSPHVKVFDGGGLFELASFFADSPNYTGGLNIAVGRVFSLDQPSIIVARRENASSIKIFGLDASLQGAFSLGQNYPGGVTLAAGNFDSDEFDEILIGTGPGGPAQLRVLNGDGSEIAGILAFDPSGYTGGIHVAATPSVAVPEPTLMATLAGAALFGFACVRRRIASNRAARSPLDV